MVAKAMNKLKQHGLTIENIQQTSEEALAKLIYGVGFWKKKADYIKKATQILIDKFNGDIPDTVEGLVRYAHTFSLMPRLPNIYRPNLPVM